MTGTTRPAIRPITKSRPLTRDEQNAGIDDGRHYETPKIQSQRHHGDRYGRDAPDDTTKPADSRRISGQVDNPATEPYPPAVCGEFVGAVGQLSGNELNTRLAFTSLRRATTDTETPGW